VREIGSRLEHRWLPVATLSKSTKRRSTRDKRGEREKAWTQASSSAFSLHSSRFRCKESRSKRGLAREQAAQREQAVSSLFEPRRLSIVAADDGERERVFARRATAFLQLPERACVTLCARLPPRLPHPRGRFLVNAWRSAGRAGGLNRTAALDRRARFLLFPFFPSSCKRFFAFSAKTFSRSISGFFSTLFSCFASHVRRLVSSLLDKQILREGERDDAPSGGKSGGPALSAEAPLSLSEVSRKRKILTGLSSPRLTRERQTERGREPLLLQLPLPSLSSCCPR
jgi:hypothetical protein